MERAPTVESHVYHEYGRMLRNLWRKKDMSRSRATPVGHASPANAARDHPLPQSFGNGFVSLVDNPEISNGDGNHANQAQENIGSWTNFDNLETGFDAGSLGLRSDTSPIRFGEGLFSGSFFPGVTNFGQQDPFSRNMMDFGDPWMSGF